MSAGGGALVTGGASGIGARIAQRLAGAGFAVHVTDVDGVGAERVASGLGGAAFASALDVTDLEGCRAAAAATAQRAGSLALWVNSAGLLRTRPAWEHPAGERAALMAVNVGGVMNGTVAALEQMRPARRGHVLNLVSLSGLVVSPGQALYAATKHAALAFSVGTQLDLRVAGAAAIHVSALCPHGVWTPMLHDLARDPQAAASWAGRRLLEPDEVADAAMTLVARPRPVLTVPRAQGPVLRAYAAVPGLMVRLAPLVMRAARRRQRAFARTLPAGAER